MKELPLYNESVFQSFETYEKKFKALADQKRLHIMYELCQRGDTCVCDLTEIFGMTQSKLSYHLKILLDANLIKKETRGTWSYYDLNDKELNGLLSEELCCIFKNTNKGRCC
ncbi:ArsR/SmtB family transcription factor [Bacillus seohaeanensis]|jgi:ArsR family transcriptional regulator, arsenate/arsenite/antimonite-responsive transcriptional repressor|uniref:ArsR/SmtB family transcription factor n=1 Tax=Bacillus seohaeanensis TaxID=284580 RepID=A0ABW5RXN7_9BACI